MGRRSVGSASRLGGVQDDLQDRLLRAHARNDRAALITGYTQAAEAQSDIDAACFFLTHAYVFALDAGDPRADDLRAKLARHGRV